MSAMTATSVNLKQSITPIRLLVFSGPCNRCSFNDVLPLFKAQSKTYLGSSGLWICHTVWCGIYQNGVQFGDFFIGHLPLGSFGNVLFYNTAVFAEKNWVSLHVAFQPH